MNLDRTSFFITDRSQGEKQFVDKGCQTDPVIIFPGFQDDINRIVKIQFELLKEEDKTDPVTISPGLQDDINRVVKHHIQFEFLKEEDKTDPVTIFPGFQDDINRVVKHQIQFELLKREGNAKEDAITQKNDVFMIEDKISEDDDISNNPGGSDKLIETVSGEEDNSFIQEVKENSTGQGSHENDEFDFLMKSSEDDLSDNECKGELKELVKHEQNDGLMKNSGHGSQNEEFDELMKSSDDDSSATESEGEFKEGTDHEHSVKDAPIETHGPRKLQCQHCDKSFTGCNAHIQLLIHWEAMFMKREETWNCPRKCGRTFTSMDYENPKEARKSLSRHVRECEDKLDHVDPPLPCEHCHETFLGQCALNSHWENIFEKKDSLGCKKCSRTFCSVDFSTSSELMMSFETHVSSCGKYRILKCEHCAKQFEGKDAAITLKLHWEEVFRNKESWSCSKGCGRIFGSGVGVNESSDYRTSTHLRKAYIHHNRQCNGPKVCNKCGRQFNIKNYIRQQSLTQTFLAHIKLCKPRKERTCGKCGKTFSRPTHLRRHVIGCLKQRTCEMCGKTFKSVSNLGRHLCSNTFKRAAREKGKKT